MSNAENRDLQEEIVRLVASGVASVPELIAEMSPVYEVSQIQDALWRLVDRRRVVIDADVQLKAA